MADRFPIIIESNEQQIQELSAGDGLDLTRSGVVNANYVHSAGVNAGVVTATSFIGDGSQITNIPAGGGSLEATASGTLPDGSTVVVNADGTVSVISQTTVSPTAGSTEIFRYADTFRMNDSVVYDTNRDRVIIFFADNTGECKAIVGTVSGTSITFGGYSTWTFSGAQGLSATFDSNSNKAVITYRDMGNSNYGTAQTATINSSGTGITFGAKSVFTSSFIAETATTFDSTNNKIVVTYNRLSSPDGAYAIVGEISGTNINFPSSAVNFASGAYAGWMSATYDTTNQKVVVAYHDGYINVAYAIVGEVSGTSISFPSSATTFESAETQWFSSVHDANNGKIVIAYTDVGNSSYGTAIVGEVSGTSISFGSPVVFESSATYYNSAVYTDDNRIAISYRGASSYGKIILGTVSGTGISFGTAFTFESAQSDHVGSVFDPDTSQVVVAYQDDPNNDYGTAIVIDPGSVTSNLTSENFIGISDGVYTNGQTATIQIAGSVDDAQSGLTPGQKYYVQGDGTLSETADSPSVLAGTAVAATKLMIG